MNRSLSTLLLLLAAIIDAAAALAFSGYFSLGPLPQMPLIVVLHLAAMAICALAVRHFDHPTQNEGEGRTTIAVLAAVLAGVAPVVGALTTAAFVYGFTGPRRSSESSPPITVGNPLRRTKFDTSYDFAPVACSLRDNDTAALRRAVSALRHQLSSASVSALRKLQSHADPRVQLDADAALMALTTAAEQRLEKLRSAAASKSCPPSTKRHLASLLHHIAVSELYHRIDSDALIDEAIDHIRRLLSDDCDDLESLHLLARCQLHRRNFASLPAILDRLGNQPDSVAVRTAWEAELHVVDGHWRSAALCAEGDDFHASPAVQRFWRGQPPAAVSA